MPRPSARCFRRSLSPGMPVGFAVAKGCGFRDADDPVAGKSGHPARCRHESRRKAVSRSAYCLSYTMTELIAAPWGSVPVWVTVRVLPSFDTAAFAVTTALPSFFQMFS